MKNRLLIIFILLTNCSFCQDTTVTWQNNIDIALFKIVYNKKEIPTELYKAIRIVKLNDIASANEDFQVGCSRSKKLPMQRLNWLACDNNNHWVLSISHGGRGYGTNYYYIDKEKGTLNSNRLFFQGPNSDALTFGETVIKMRMKQFSR